MSRHRLATVSSAPHHPSCSCYSPPTEVTEALNSPLTQKRNVVLSDHVSCPSLTCVSALTGQQQQNLLRGASGESAWEGRYSWRRCAQKEQLQR